MVHHMHCCVGTVHLYFVSTALPQPNRTAEKVEADDANEKRIDSEHCHRSIRETAAS